MFPAKKAIQILVVAMTCFLGVGCGDEPAGPDPDPDPDPQSQGPTLVGWWRLDSTDSADQSYWGFSEDGWCTWIDLPEFGETTCFHVTYTVSADSVTISLPDGSAPVTFIFGFDEVGRLWLQPSSRPQRVYLDATPESVVPTHICG
jgi:hypothetical protein